MASPPASHYVGQRISFKGNLCTVRYVGEIDGLKGAWLGVEWDDPDRGKHSGEHDGVRYFECLSKTPTAGSFVRPNRPSDPPQDFIRALRQKYASETLEAGGVTRNALYHNQPIRISATKMAEEVGFDKIRRQMANLKELRIVLVDGQCVKMPLSQEDLARWQRADASDSSGRPSDIKEVCPRIAELDVSRNVFEDWREVLYIGEQLEQLREIRANGNRFRNIELSDAETHYFKSVFPRIKSLSLDETYMSWEELVDTANIFNTLTYLSASANSIKSLTPSIPPSSLTTIILENNGFTSLGDVATLTALPKLERLTLKNNSISRTHTADTTAPVFSPTLESLDISSNDISTWSFIDALPILFPGLGSLRISRNPLFNSLVSPANEPLTADDGYLLTVARLAPLHTLNFSRIPAQERTNAELWYLSQIGVELSLRPAGSADAVIAEHPRYHELCRLYDRDPAAALQHAGQAGNPRALAARLVTVEAKLSPAAAAKAETKDPAATLEVPRGFSVYAVLGLVGKRFGLWPMGLRLVWETGDWDFVRGQVVEDQEWDSEEEEGNGATELGRRVPREIVIWPSTKPFGTQVDGETAVVRVELRNEGSS